MKRKIALFTVIFAVSVLLGVEAVEFVDANPVPWLTTPNQDKPTLTIMSPQNYTTYNSNSLYLNFTAIKPDSWKIYIVAPYVGRMHSADVYLDGALISRYGYSGSVFVKLDQSTSELNQTVPGAHTLNVTVLSYTYYRGPAYNNSHILSDISSSSGPVYEYPIVVSDIVYFNVVGWSSQSPTPSIAPTPTIPEFSWLMILPLFIFILSIAVLVRSRRISRRISRPIQTYLIMHCDTWVTVRLCNA